MLIYFVQFENTFRLVDYTKTWSNLKMCRRSLILTEFWCAQDS